MVLGFSATQVRTFFSWTQWVFNVVLQNRQRVLLNMDETSLPMVVTKKRGHVVQLPRGGAREQQCERVSSRDSQGSMTLVAFLGWPGTLQSQLPQFLLTRDKILSAEEKCRLRALVPPLVWLPGSNGWMTARLLCQILTAVRRSIHRHCPGHEIALWSPHAQCLLCAAECRARLAQRTCAGCASPLPSSRRCWTGMVGQGACLRLQPASARLSPAQTPAMTRRGRTHQRVRDVCVI